MSAGTFILVVVNAVKGPELSNAPYTLPPVARGECLSSELLQAQCGLVLERSKEERREMSFKRKKITQLGMIFFQNPLPYRMKE